jgi:uncharacterized protein YyaL (SSP411 family)
VRWLVVLVLIACQRDRQPAHLPGAEPFEAEVASAIAAKKGDAKYTNRLILERSPYLLQHAHNPVDWRPWGAEALAAAKRLNRPILLSIGYSTCHWCHVMERESFEDVEIATAINRTVIAIKVDREERPDLDRSYMAAVQRLTGSSGWPLTVFLLPDGKPFFGGTYFPPRDGDRGKGLLSILEELDKAYREDPAALAQYATALIAELDRPPPRGDVPGPGAITAAVDELKKSFDPTWGGWGRAPKFPRPSVIELLLHHHRRTGDATSLEMATRTLDRIAAGGIRDHVGGGFHRYTVDDKWRVPHFEKMLYDNAQLASVYLAAYQVTGRAAYAAVARDTLDYLAREMRDPANGFYAASDADSEGHEGSYFVWTAAEVERVTGGDAAIVREVFDLTVGGNFERGANILWRPRTMAEVAERLTKSPAEIEQALARAVPKLRAARETRVKPFLDKKILVAWNALAISAFAQAGLILDDPAYRDLARAAAGAVLGKMTDGLAHAIVDGVAVGKGYLDDHAFLVAALLDLYEAVPDPRWLERAIAWQAIQDKAFADPAGGYVLSSGSHEKLQITDRFEHDDATPAASSIAASNLLRLYELTGDEAYRKRAIGTLEASGALLAKAPGAMPRMLVSLDYLLDKPKQIVLLAPVGGSSELLLQEVRRAYVPNRVLVRVTEGEPSMSPLVEGKTARGGKPTAYVCVGTHCEQPTTDPAQLAQQLAKTEPL